MNRSELIKKMRVLSTAYSDGQLSYQDYRNQRAMLIDALQFDLKIDANARLKEVFMDINQNYSRASDTTARSRKVTSRPNLRDGSNTQEDSGQATKGSLVNAQFSMRLYFSVVALIITAVLVVTL